MNRRLHSILLALLFAGVLSAGPLVAEVLTRKVAPGESVRIDVDGTVLDVSVDRPAVVRVKRTPGDDTILDATATPPATRPAVVPAPPPSPPPSGVEVLQAKENVPFFLDTGDEATWGRFTMQGYKDRTGYRVGYALRPGSYNASILGRPVRVDVEAYAPLRRDVFRKGESFAVFVANLQDDTEVTAEPGAVAVLDRAVILDRDNVRLDRLTFESRPKSRRDFVGLYIRGKGVLVDEPKVVGANVTKNKYGGQDFLRVLAGGSAVVRGGVVDQCDMAFHTALKSEGLVAENVTIKRSLGYAAFISGGVVGASFSNFTVESWDNEPGFRVSPAPGAENECRNVYFGYTKLTRLRDGADKDGVTPRGGSRLATDHVEFIGRQFRSGQDADAVKNGVVDPSHVLLYGCTFSGTYADHKKGSGRSDGIWYVNNTFNAPAYPGGAPIKSGPIIGFGARSGGVMNNRWLGGPATWKPAAAAGVKVQANTGR